MRKLGLRLRNSQKNEHIKGIFNCSDGAALWRTVSFTGKDNIFAYGIKTHLKSFPFYFRFRKSLRRRWRMEWIMEQWRRRRKKKMRVGTGGTTSRE
jgi:hypothetical protein